MSGFYDIAQICLNGHIVNDNYSKYPQHNQDYCDKCGEPTIFKCQSCGAEVRGEYHSSGVLSIGGRKKAPNFCHECGKPYPWIARKLEVVREMTDELEELTLEEREKIKKSLDDLVAETPKTEVAVLRFKKALKKVGKDSYESIKSILVDVASEAIKKSLFGK
ncbi:MAG TPA: DUF2321 domain-containing protein [Candidatus Omnitrophota bacterium]|nr:DUF2321 domain-containing protein [Candidatus Omnitrophota bacterium]